ncbi:hypothetical protein SDC9_118981 [bioreactor metagenome]|uniref:Uncharacterized protein n=1 Tax=bioreactor metagenome TaxID=1076179 RepID=A0A645C3R4_9ZZZZ
MTKIEMVNLMKQCVNPHKICRVFFKYGINYWYYFPLIVNEKFFLGAEEDDFILNGYSIRRFKDMKKVEIKDDKCLEINMLEGTVDQLIIPNVDITNWKTIFSSLKAIDHSVIVEQESLIEDECQFVIGRIEKIFNNHVYIRGFDADGVWEDEFYKIPYAEITSVTFGSRYVEIFSKYLPPIK